MIEKDLTFIALVALAAWVPLCGLLFIVLPTRTAVLAATLLGYLFLPQGELKVPGVLPDVDRHVVVHCVVLLCVAAFDLRRLLRVRPRLYDLPVIVWCGCALLSSVSNGLGVYDGLSGVMQRGITYGIPYVLGRVYFSDLVGLRHVAITVVIGGLIYAPLCLYEIRMSPQLHLMVYGYHAHVFYQTHRLGGWRPTVFLQHGLAVGMWMTSASLLGVWLIVSGAVRRQDRYLAVPLVLALVATTLVCKSLGALVLLAVGLGVLVASRALGRAWPILILTLLPPLYVTVRTTELWTGEDLVRTLAQDVSEDRAQSLQFRLNNETLLARKALEQPILGWAGYGRAAVEDERGERRTVVDGLWIHAIGQNGLLGLTALGAMFLLPVITYLRSRTAAQLRAEPEAVALATLVALVSIDALLNAMFNPFTIIALSGLSAFALGHERRRAAREAPLAGYLPGRVAFA